MSNLSLSRQVRIEPLEARIAPAFVSSPMQLADLDGKTGSAFHGANPGDSSGHSATAAGDVNGDGFGDFIVGAPGVASAKGAAYVVFGTAAGFPKDVTFDANFLDGRKGFALVGEASAASGEAGYAVGAAGDVNGDGFADVIVGAITADGAASGSGAAYVVFGKASGFPAQMPLGSLDGSNGFKLSGAATSDRVGSAVSGAGDVNGDGFADVIVGGYNVGGKGAAFIIFGKAGGFAANLNLSGLTSAQGVQLNGEASGDGAGFPVSSAGDVNGDGLADVIVGADTADGSGNDNRGAAYVVFGGKALPAVIELNSLTGATGFKLKGGADKDYAGVAASGAGDVNGDGFADVIVGSLNGRGAAYVIFGHAGAFTTPIDLSAIPTGAGFTITGAGIGDRAGAALGHAGDVNGDGFADLLIGFPQSGTAAQVGGAAVVFGHAGPFSSLDLGSLNGVNGFRLDADELFSRTGRVVGGAGDVNGDGFADLLISTNLSDDGGMDIGKTYLVLGGPSGAFVFPDGISAKLTSATFTDVDGDLVTVKVSKGFFDPLGTNFKLLASSATGTPKQLLSLSLVAGFDGSSFDGADVSITVTKRAPGGDGKVNVGFIDATGVDLGNVTVGGDLGKIVAGDADDGTALKSLTVDSLGLFGGHTGDTGAGIFSKITGPVGPVKIAGDVSEAAFQVTPATDDGVGTVASLTIGGSLIGGKIGGSGSFSVHDAIGPVKIAGDIIGGDGDFSGRLHGGALSSGAFGGSVLAGRGAASGEVNGSSVGAVKIGGNLTGTLIGGERLGPVKITGDLLGGSILAGNTDAVLAGVTIGGDARGGRISSEGSVGPVVIGGDAVGTAATPFIIEGLGSSSRPVAIASVKVGGDLEHALIVAGHPDEGDGSDGRAQIGAITVGGDWIASSASASVVDAQGRYALLGNGSDQFPAGGPANVVASIQSVTIKGAARGTFEDSDRYAIVAEQIGSVSIGGVKLPLTKSKTADPANDLTAVHVGLTPDFVVREISRTAAQPAEPDVTTPAAGSRSAFPASFNPAGLNGSNGFRINGEALSDYAGSVSGIGDFNGDGLDDLLIGAGGADPNGTDSGAGYVVFGQAGGFGNPLELSTLDGSNGFKIEGEAAGDLTGISVSRAGDVNGDGFADLLIGSFHSNQNGQYSGVAYVVFGHAGASGTLKLSALDGGNGFKMVGEHAGDRLGAVGAAGDVNGDGFDDIIVGASGAAPHGDFSGASYVIFGKKGGFTPQVDLSTLDGKNGFKMFGTAKYDGVGVAVSGAGDFNGDGLDDLLVGAFGAPNNTGVGVTYVIFGQRGMVTTPLELSALTSQQGFKIQGENPGDVSGRALSVAGDVNGDGFADLIINSYRAAPHGSESGASYVVFGHATGFANLNLADLDGRNGFKLNAVSQDDRLASVAGAGDVNGDGFDDLILGAYFANPDNGPVTGAAYVVFGHPGTFAKTLELSALDGSNGFRIPGESLGDTMGRSVSGAGDVNGDGFADIIVGANQANPHGNDSGTSYVVYGGPSGEFIDPTISTDHKTATWTDVDGDLVTLKFSRGVEALLDAGTFKLLAKSTTDSHAQLLELHLGSNFDGVDVSITAKRAGGGDGKVNVGFLNAGGADLGAVNIAGDVGAFTIGDASDDPGLKSLTLGSLGVLGDHTQDTGGQLLSQVTGSVGAVKIAGDVHEAELLVKGTAHSPGSIASLTLGGSLIGGAKNAGVFDNDLGPLGPGLIAAADSIGPVKIGGDIVGGAAPFSGELHGRGIASLTLGGSLLGGAGFGSGDVVSAVSKLGSVTIGGDQVGGRGDSSGRLVSNQAGFGKVIIKGSQLGGSAANSGAIVAFGTGGDIASVTIGGDARGGDVDFSGGILAGGTLGPVVINGDVIGTAGHAYTIRGSGPLTGAQSVAIASVKVGSDFDHALLLAGYGNNDVPVNGHAQIGAITIGGDWLASSATAGVLTHTGATNATGVFGNGDDTFINGGPDGVIASIASITIKGRAVGSLETGDFFGIVAESIGSASIGGVKLTLTGAADKIALGPTPDFFLREVARV